MFLVRPESSCFRIDVIDRNERFAAGMPKATIQTATARFAVFRRARIYLRIITGSRQGFSVPSKLFGVTAAVRKYRKLENYCPPFRFHQPASYYYYYYWSLCSVDLSTTVNIEECRRRTFSITRTRVVRSIYVTRWTPTRRCRSAILAHRRNDRYREQ